MAGDRLGVVAGGHGDDAALALLGRQQRQAVGGAALLECAGDLEIVEFQHHLGAGQAGDGRIGNHRGAYHPPGDPLGRLLDVLKRDHSLP